MCLRTAELRSPSVGTLLSNLLTDFTARFDGPLHFRLIAQPLMAIFLAARDGRRDARARRGAYVWTLANKPEHRAYLLESGVKGISKVFVMALALDVAYQFLEWGGLKPLQAVTTATVLAVIPYVLLRGPVNRVIRIIQTRRSRA
jgi:hypothetical protein